MLNPDDRFERTAAHLPPEHRGLENSLNAALQSGDVPMLLGEVRRAVRSYGISRLSRMTGFDRVNIYKMLSSEGNPKIGSLIKILDVIGVRLEVRAHTRNGAEASEARIGATEFTWLGSK